MRLEVNKEAAVKRAQQYAVEFMEEQRAEGFVDPQTACNAVYMSSMLAGMFASLSAQMIKAFGMDDPESLAINTKMTVDAMADGAYLVNVEALDCGDS